MKDLGKYHYRVLKELFAYLKREKSYMDVIDLLKKIEREEHANSEDPEMQEALEVKELYVRFNGKDMKGIEELRCILSYIDGHPLKNETVADIRKAVDEAEIEIYYADLADIVKEEG